MSDTLKQIADNLGVTTVNGNYLSGIAQYYGVNLATSKDLMADILTAVGGNPATSSDYLKDIVLALGGTVTINANWMEAWKLISALVPPVNIVAPVISGSTIVGSVLTTTNGTWNGTPTSFAYQWYRGLVQIFGETLSTYTLVVADSTASITCKVTATNASGSTQATSNIITANNYTPVSTVAPVVTGATTLGSILTTTNGTWTNSPSFTYQWKRGATNIGTNTNTYTLVTADSTESITCVVTATNAAGFASATSNTITASNYTPVNTVAPVISGSTPVGSTLTTTNGTWTNSPTFAYQWYRGATLITSATASTYVTVTADTGLAVTCRVTGTNAVGSAIGISNAITPTAVVTPFAFTANTNNISTGSSTATQFKLPLSTSTGLNIVVSWGDATTSTITNRLDAAVTHTYASAGTYSISITGTLPGFQFANGGDRLKILNIASYGILNITTNAAFQGCTNLISNATDAPTITTTDLSATFRNCTNFNGAIVNWNTSAVTNMNTMFTNASAFNQPLSFNTAAVTNMSSMFSGATVFNQPLSFSTGAVTDMNSMFSTATNFNGTLTFSSTAAVTNMSFMFSNTNAFNKLLSFNTAAVTNMSYMFYYAPAFNQPLTFNTALVTTMSSMFEGATAFNQNLGALNVANVTNFTSFMLGKTPATFSTTNLDAIYNGWVTVQSSKVITFGTAKYSAAGTAGRNYLTGTKLWTITDGGL